jgi:hypothetical protein
MQQWPKHALGGLGLNYGIDSLSVGHSNALGAASGRDAPSSGGDVLGKCSGSALHQDLSHTRARPWRGALLSDHTRWAREGRLRVPLLPPLCLHCRLLSRARRVPQRHVDPPLHAVPCGCARAGTTPRRRRNCVRRRMGANLRGGCCAVMPSLGRRAQQAHGQRLRPRRPRLWHDGGAEGKGARAGSGRDGGGAAGDQDELGSARGVALAQAD